MKYKMSEIDPKAIKATNIREVEKRKLRTIVESLKVDGLQYPIIIRPLTPEEIEESRQRNLQEFDDKINTTTSEAAKKRLEKKKAEYEPARFGIIDGHTRYAAAILAKFREIDATVRDAESDEIEKAKAFKANVARVDMEKWEKGKYLVGIMDRLIAQDPDKYKNAKKQALIDAASSIGWGSSYAYQVKKAYEQHLQPVTANSNENKQKYNIKYSDINNDLETIFNKLGHNNVAKFEDTTDKINAINELRAIKQALDVIVETIESDDEVQKQYIAERNESKKRKEDQINESGQVTYIAEKLTKDKNKYLYKHAQLKPKAATGGATPQSFLSKLKKK